MTPAGPVRPTTVPTWSWGGKPRTRAAAARLLTLVSPWGVGEAAELGRRTGQGHRPHVGCRHSGRCPRGHGALPSLPAQSARIIPLPSAAAHGSPLNLVMALEPWGGSATPLHPDVRPWRRGWGHRMCRSGTWGGFISVVGAIPTTPAPSHPRTHRLAPTPLGPQPCPCAAAEVASWDHVPRGLSTSHRCLRLGLHPRLALCAVSRAPRPGLRLRSGAGAFSIWGGDPPFGLRHGHGALLCVREPRGTPCPRTSLFFVLNCLSFRCVFYWGWGSFSCISGPPRYTWVNLVLAFPWL